MSSSLRELDPVHALLKFTGAVEHDPAIHAWFEMQRADLGAIAWTWFAKMRRCGPDIRELMHDRCPTVCVASAPFAYVNAFTAHVNVGFFHGASLSDPSKLLQGTGRYMRHVKLKPALAFDQPALQALIVRAYADIRARLHADGMRVSPDR